jgi:hypothetical protein
MQAAKDNNFYNRIFYQNLMWLAIVNKANPKCYENPKKQDSKSRTC